MKGRDPVIVNRADGPTITSIGVDVLLRKVMAFSISFEKSGRFRVEVGRRLKRCNRIWQRSSSGSTRRCILLSKKLLCFRRPGHQLAVKTYPVGSELVPKPCRFHCASDASNQLPFQIRFGKKTPAGSCVTNAWTFPNYAEHPPCGFFVTAGD